MLNDCTGQRTVHEVCTEFVQCVVLYMIKHTSLH